MSKRRSKGRKEGVGVKRHTPKKVSDEKEGCFFKYKLLSKVKKIFVLINIPYFLALSFVPYHVFTLQRTIKSNILKFYKKKKGAVARNENTCSISLK